MYEFVSKIGEGVDDVGAFSDWENVDWPEFNDGTTANDVDSQKDDETLANSHEMNAEKEGEERRWAASDLLVHMAAGEMTVDNEYQRETYEYVRDLLERKCKELGVDYNSIDIDKICEEKISVFCAQVNEENGTNFTFTFKDFKKQLSQYLSQVDSMEPDIRLGYFDSLTKSDTFLKGGTVGIFAVMQRYLGNSENLHAFINELILEDTTMMSPEVEAIFGDPEPKKVSREEQEKAKNVFEEFMAKYELAKLYTDRKVHSREVAKMREKIYMDIEVSKNPDYVEALEKLKSDKDIIYFSMDQLVKKFRKK